MKNSKLNAFPDIYSNEGSGLTKREYFAAMAMQGLLSSMNPKAHGFEPNEFTVNYCVGLSIKAADELLKQLES